VKTRELGGLFARSRWSRKIYVISVNSVTLQNFSGDSMANFFAAGCLFATDGIA
jgi:hypothetical protein